MRKKGRILMMCHSLNLPFLSRNRQTFGNNTLETIFFNSLAHSHMLDDMKMRQIQRLEEYGSKRHNAENIDSHRNDFYCCHLNYFFNAEKK